MTQAPRRETADLLALWFGLLAGPLAWLAHLATVYLLETLACIANLAAARPLIYLVTLVAALIALAGVLVAGRNSRRAGVEAEGHLGESGGRPGFMAVTGAQLSGISLLAIFVQSLGVPFLQSCR